MESFQRGDRVSLKEPLGPITTGEYGLVVEVYPRNETPDGTVVGSKDFDMFGQQTLFDYGVVFTGLRHRAGGEEYNNGPWFTDKIDLSQFRTNVGNHSMQVEVIPFAHDELDYIDSELRGVMQ